MDKDRVKKAQQKHHRALIEELELIERCKPSGYEAFRFHRHFVRTTLWPPLHNRAEIQRYLDYYRNAQSRQRKYNSVI